ncbi:hypothetical protein [Hominifimenecus sp. rT4P-3]|uniref:hypothetical protein n=1 Tax=Hominifimenecus sp. rT4P-3 TaxID=3242979 RepID=UPI003DA42A29
MKKLSLLNHVYQNTQMGLESLPLLKSKSQDTTFQKAIDHQYREYKQINQRAQNLMKKKHITPKDVRPTAKMSATVMTNMKTLMDRSTSHLAEMVIQGNTMGVTQITRALHETKAPDAEVKALAQQLLKTTDNNLQALRKFL